MSQIQKWIWEAYFAIVLSFAILKVYHLVVPGSPEFLYYTILRSFSSISNIEYGAHVIHIVLNLVHCVPLFLYIHRINFLNPNVWKILLILRFVFEIFGRPYEINTFAALNHSNPKALLFIIAAMIIQIIPSYFACYQYAFKSRTQ